MIDHELRKSIYLLHQSGLGIREICHRFNVSRNCVRAIIRGRGENSRKTRKDKIVIDPARLEDLYKRCNGYKERMHEILTGEGIAISYSTLTRRVRSIELSNSKMRCSYVDDEPGKEMQHDTSPYTLLLGQSRVKVIGSIIYFRFSKRRYLKFYRNFTRFRMKCFLHEALTHLGYAAEKCIIDNTNLAVESGSGKNALMSLEMQRFAEQFNFEFQAHEIKHSNRKAGNERCFWTVETNFFPGREFANLEDLNRHALEWSTVTMAERPLTKKKIVPSQAFEEEKPYLKKVWPHLPLPYMSHDRLTDQYGYVSFGANYYWVPGSGRYPVKILEYSDNIVIYHERKKLAEYALPPDGTRDRRIPERSGISHFPNNDKRRSISEEKDLRRLGSVVSDYLDFILQTKGIRRHQFILNLHRMSRLAGGDAFLSALERAMKYRVIDLGAVERMMIYEMNSSGLEVTDLDLDPEYLKRKSYQDGLFGDRPDMSIYEELIKTEESDG